MDIVPRVWRNISPHGYNYGTKALTEQIIWEGKNEKEVGKDSKTGKMLVKVDPKYYRPTEKRFSKK